MANIVVLNGPNLNLLGEREPEIYGKETLADISERLARLGQSAGYALDFFQSNGEGALVDRIHEAFRQKVEFFLINPGAYTHTSIALRDALIATKIPFIEIHLSNIHGREAFRKHSYLSDVARGVICGLGARGYEYALQAAIHELEQKKVAIHGH
jgi:3-dehydroquinate dehydratase-2